MKLTTEEVIPLDLKTEAAVFIREKRIAMGLSQYALAKIVFGNTDSRNRIHKLENGDRGIGLETLGQVLSHMNCYIEFKER